MRTVVFRDGRKVTFKHKRKPGKKPKRKPSAYNIFIGKYLKGKKAGTRAEVQRNFKEAVAEWNRRK